MDTVVKHLAQNADRHSLPAPYPIMGPEILRWSIRFMEETARDIRLSPKKQAIRYRQALMIGFLANCPVRRRTLLAMNVGTHVLPNTSGYALQFSAADMKDHKARNFHLPVVLVEPMRAYLGHYRPILLNDVKADALWINQYGRGITKDGLSRELPKITERYLAVALHPHAFRHIAATSIAELDPENANIMRDILGHATLDTAYKHYNRTMGISSCNALQSLVDDIDESVPMAGRAKVQVLPHNDGGANICRKTKNW